MTSQKKLGNVNVGEAWLLALVKLAVALRQQLEGLSYGERGEYKRDKPIFKSFSGLSSLCSTSCKSKRSQASGDDDAYHCDRGDGQVVLFFALQSPEMESVREEGLPSVPQCLDVDRAFKERLLREAKSNDQLCLVNVLGVDRKGAALGNLLR